MLLLEYFNSIDLGEIDRFVAEGREENVSLEFKSVNHPSHIVDHDRKNLSTALSGFGNSSGGIIIWGIKAKKSKQGQDVASDKAPIPELTKFLNFLNRTEGHAVIPIISGVLHEKIEEGKDIGYAKSFVPPSDAAPHMALFGGKHYYKRSGDSFYQCEHYDIMDMISRKTSPDLELVAKVLPTADSHHEKRRYEIVIGIRNNGKAMAKYPSLAMNCNHDYRPWEHGLDGNGNCGLQKVANNTVYRFNYGGGINTVIYPGAVLDVNKFITEINKSEGPADFKIEYMLFAENMDNRTGEKIVDTRTILIESVKLP